MMDLKSSARELRLASSHMTPIQAGRFVKLFVTSINVLIGAMPSVFSCPMDSVKNLPKKLLFGLELGFCTAAIFGTLTLPAFASPLPAPSFDRLASSCAPGVTLATLRAVAAVESHFEPWAVRDNTTREARTPASLAAAIVLAEDRLKKGHSLDLGVMQINSANLASLGIGVADAFDPCRSLGAAGHILQNAFAASSGEAERQAAILIAFSRYNTGRPLAGIANGYVDQVIAAQMAHPLGTTAPQIAPNTASLWDIWGTSHAEVASWVVTADGSSKTVRAGAQSNDARNEGRAPASRSEKGEPYEVFAYQESKPPKP